MIFNNFNKITLIILSFVLISFSANANDVITIGVATPLNGDFSKSGASVLEGVTIAVNNLNAQGGILGKKIVITTEDDECNPKLATEVAHKLITDKVDAVIGHLCSGATRAALPIYTEEKIIVISPSAANIDLTKSRSFPYFLRTIPPSNLQSKLCVEFALKRLKAKKIAIIHDNTDYGKTYADFIKRFVETDKYSSVVMFEQINIGQTDYSSIIKKISKSNADTLFFGGYHPEAAKLISQIKEHDINIAFISSVSLNTNAFLELAGKNANGVYVAGKKDHSALELNKKASLEMQNLYNKQPGDFYFESYAAMLAIANAFETAGTTNSDQVLKALKTKKTNTPLGEIIFDTYGDLVNGNFQMYQVKDGKFISVE